MTGTVTCLFVSHSAKWHVPLHCDMCIDWHHVPACEVVTLQKYAVLLKCEGPDELVCKMLFFRLMWYIEMFIDIMWCVVCNQVTGSLLLSPNFLNLKFCPLLMRQSVTYLNVCVMLWTALHIFMLGLSTRKGARSGGLQHRM